MSAATWIASSAILLASLFSGTAQAAGCRDMVFEDTPFTLCEADPATDDIRLFLGDDDGRPLGTFENVDASLASEGRRLAFAVNAGMYHPDRRPVGLYVEDGTERARIVTRKGPGNFGLLPNGVLCIGDDWARVVESRAFAAEPPACRYATQSGPMLVIDGALHPRFLPDSRSRYIRNGVGATPEGQMIVAISNRPVTFHRFARFFRDVLGTPNALFLDGNISRLYAPELRRQDFGFPMGPILGVTVPTD